MEMRTVGIYHEDAEYAKAMAERLCLKLRDVCVAAVDHIPQDRSEVYIMEQYMSASEAAEDVSAKFGIRKQPDGEGECILTGFTSGAGGAGTSSAALAMGHIYTQLYGYKTLYLSFDALALKSGLSAGDSLQKIYSLVYGEEEKVKDGIFAQDSEGLFFLGSDGIINPLSFIDSSGACALADRLSGCFERIVADIPFCWSGAMDLLDICDNAVVCFGWQQERWALSQALSDHLGGIRDRVFEFRPLLDEFGTEDIYGQFGSEVRALAQQIEKG